MRRNNRLIDDALQKFRNNYKELALIIYKQEKQIQFLETKALHLALFYVASQLVIFLSNSKPSVVHQCRNWWKPFFISLTIAIAFGMNFITTVIKYMQMKYEQERNFIDQEANYHQMVYLERNGMNEREGEESSSSMEQLEPDLFGVRKRYIHIGITGCALLAFTIVVLHTCRSSACANPA